MPDIIYAVPGTNQQSIFPANYQPNPSEIAGMVRMQEPRPGDNYVANEDGTWIDNTLVALAAEVRSVRDAKIDAEAWRYQRNARETRLGLTPTDDLVTLDTYIQALAEVPEQAGFPSEVVWPEKPW